MNFKKAIYLLVLLPLLAGCNPTTTNPTSSLISFIEDSISVEPGKGYALHYSFTKESINNKRVTFSSSDDSIAKVTNKGIVEGKAFGTATITITSLEDNSTDTCAVVVENGPTKEPLVIPTVDVDSLDINLPNKPTRVYNQSDISHDETYDYINFYEVSDFHGAVNYSLNSESCNLGLSKMATYFEQLRSQNKGGTVLLSTGDMYQGSVESNLTRGYLVNYAMNYMGFDAMAVGNHEFDWGESWLRKNANLSYNGDKIPFLGANIQYTNGEMPTYLKKSTIITRGNYKIGIIGTIGSTLESSIAKQNVIDFNFVDEEQIVKDEASRLKTNENCDIVVWLAHESVDDLASKNFKKSDNIDAIFGGHAHVSNYEYPMTANDIPIAATANYGQGIASIKLKINKSTKEVSNSYTSVINNYPTLNNNNDIDSIMNQYNTHIDEIKNIKLGHTSRELDIDGFLANICVDTMRLSASKFVETSDLAEGERLPVVAAFHNVGGGIRTNIQQGDITYGNVYAPFPFDNEIVLVKETGRQIKNIISSYPYSTWGHWKTDNFNALENNSYYYYAITDFLAYSRTTLTEQDTIPTGLIVRDEIANFIYEENEINVSDSYLYKGNFN